MEPVIVEYLGAIKLFAFNYAPIGWLPCDGRSVSLYEHQALFVALGSKPEDDKYRSFKIPDLRGTEPVKGMGYFICVNGYYPVRDR